MRVHDHGIFDGACLRRIRLPMLACALGFLSATSAHAEAPKQDAAVQQVLRKAQGALRQLSQEKEQLAADNATLQKEKADLQKQLQDQAAKLEATIKQQLEPLQAEVAKQKAAAEALKNANAGLETQIASDKEREQRLRGKFKETVGVARNIQSDNQLLVEAVKEREQWISQCQQKNAAMLEANDEVVRRYEEKGFWEKFGDLEPVTGIGKVKTENTAQDYHFKLQDLKATPFQSTVPTTGQATTAAPAIEEDEPE